MLPTLCVFCVVVAARLDLVCMEGQECFADQDADSLNSIQVAEPEVPHSFIELDVPGNNAAPNTGKNRFGGQPPRQQRTRLPVAAVAAKRPSGPLLGVAGTQASIGGAYRKPSAGRNTKLLGPFFDARKQRALPNTGKPVVKPGKPLVPRTIPEEIPLLQNKYPELVQGYARDVVQLLQDDKALANVGAAFEVLCKFFDEKIFSEEEEPEPEPEDDAPELKSECPQELDSRLFERYDEDVAACADASNRWTATDTSLGGGAYGQVFGVERHGVFGAMKMSTSPEGSSDWKLDASTQAKEYCVMHAIAESQGVCTDEGKSRILQGIAMTPCFYGTTSDRDEMVYSALVEDESAILAGSHGPFGEVHRVGPGGYVMEQLDGDITNLEEKVLKDCAANLVEQIHSALVCTHAAGYVHLDLKGPNIMYKNAPVEGDCPDVKLGDFGLAQAIGSEVERFGDSAYSSYYLPGQMFRDGDAEARLVEEARLEAREALAQAFERLDKDPTQVEGVLVAAELAGAGGALTKLRAALKYTALPRLDWCSFVFMARGTSDTTHLSLGPLGLVNYASVPIPGYDTLVDDCGNFGIGRRFDAESGTRIGGTLITYYGNADGVPAPAHCHDSKGEPSGELCPGTRVDDSVGSNWSDSTDSTVTWDSPED